MDAISCASVICAKLFQSIKDFELKACVTALIFIRLSKCLMVVTENESLWIHHELPVACSSSLLMPPDWRFGIWFPFHCKPFQESPNHVPSPAGTQKCLSQSSLCSEEWDQSKRYAPGKPEQQTHNPSSMWLITCLIRFHQDKHKRANASYAPTKQPLKTPNRLQITNWNFWHSGNIDD